MDVNDLKIRLDCVHAVHAGKTGGCDHIREDLWFREHEAELIAAAKARQAAAGANQPDCAPNAKSTPPAPPKAAN